MYLPECLPAKLFHPVHVAYTPHTVHSHRATHAQDSPTIVLAHLPYKKDKNDRKK
jgi:hypothetical protein